MRGRGGVAHHVVFERLEGVDEELGPLAALIEAELGPLARQVEHAAEQRAELGRVRLEGCPCRDALTELEVDEDDDRHQVDPRRARWLEVGPEVALQVARHLQRGERIAGRPLLARRLPQVLGIDLLDDGGIEGRSVREPVLIGEHLDGLLGGVLLLGARTLRAAVGCGTRQRPRRSLAATALAAALAAALASCLALAASLALATSLAATLAAALAAALTPRPLTGREFVGHAHTRRRRGWSRGLITACHWTTELGRVRSIPITRKMRVAR